MATTTTRPAAQLTVSLEMIDAPTNVRELDPEHVKALAGSIALQGMLVPLVVRPAGDRFELVAGFHRLAAATELGLAEVPVVIRDSEQEAVDRAVENIARKQLNPYEEALAVHAMLGKGLSEDGAGQALGWSQQRVAARVKLLELPERAQQLIGAGTIALSAVDSLLQIGRVSPALLNALVEYLDDGNEWAAERLTREPGWVLDAALRHGSGCVFAAHLSQLDSHQIAELKLGKKLDALLEEAAGLHKQVDRYSYGLPPIRFSDQEVDQARAAGVVIEFERSAPIIVDRPLYRELAKQAIGRTIEELRRKAATRQAERNSSRSSNSDQRVDPVAEARREEQRQLRELADQAHGANLDLGAQLLGGLSKVDPGDINVARFFVYALLGADHDSSPYTQQGERVARLAAGGIRLVIDEFRTDVTKTLKDGGRGKLRIDYGDHRQPEQPIRWLWRFVDGARSAGELYGRALVVICAEQHASRLVVPAGQRTPAIRWSSHKDQAAKALKKLAGPHLPATLAPLERAIARAHRDAIRSKTQSPDTKAASTADAEQDQHGPEADEYGLVDAVDADTWEVEVSGVVGADGSVKSDTEPWL